MHIAKDVGWASSLLLHRLWVNEESLCFMYFALYHTPAHFYEMLPISASQGALAVAVALTTYVWLPVAFVEDGIWIGAVLAHVILNVGGS